MQQTINNNVENKNYIHTEGLTLESGDHLAQVKINYSTYGTFQKEKNK